MASIETRQVAEGVLTASAESAAERTTVIIPVLNEEENIPILHQALTEAMRGRDYELIFVDDGSVDGSPQVLRSIAESDEEHVTVIEFRRNFGQTTAIAAGIDYSGGKVVVLIDADMQNDPSDIPMMLDKIDEGYDVVSGWRQNRKDPYLTRRLPSKVANWLISRVTGVALHDYGCTLKAYRRDVLQGFRLYGEMHRFIPAYAGSVGARIVEVPVKHHPRLHGKPNYGLERTIKVILDLFTVKFLISYARTPIYIFGGLGLILIAPSSAVLAFLFIRRVLLSTSVLNSPLFSTSIMLVILGFLCILMGFIAELLVRTYHESQAKPTYSIRRVLNGKGGPARN
jgi:glycosyltransferase involved in cell wall biosynthesis